MDSRYSYNDFDAKGFLQSLEPPFPLNDVVSNDRFWSRHFLVLQDGPFRFLLLNSSAYHGARQEGLPPEYEHGRISPKTLHAIAADLASRTEKKINVLICHHHPQKHDDIEAADSSVMEMGEKLIQLLGQGTGGLAHPPRTQTPSTPRLWGQ